jgi:hypothetical protein
MFPFQQGDTHDRICQSIAGWTTGTPSLKRLIASKRFNVRTVYIKFVGTPLLTRLLIRIDDVDAELRV